MKSGGELYLGFPIIIRIFDVKTDKIFHIQRGKKILKNPRLNVFTYMLFKVRIGLARSRGANGQFSNNFASPDA